MKKNSNNQATPRNQLLERTTKIKTVVYKEQLRLNQAASSTLMARLEAQRATCDSAENELRRKYKQRDRMEIQTRSCSEQPRKRLRIYDDLPDNSSILSSTRRERRPTKKELREFLEAEQRASEAGISLSFDDEEKLEKEKTDEIVNTINEDEAHLHTYSLIEKKILDARHRLLGIGQISEDEVCLNYNKLKGTSTGKESCKKLKQIYNVEGNGTNLVSKSQKLMTINSKPNQIQHSELNVIKTNDSCMRINHQKKKSCRSSYNAEEGNYTILVNNNLKQVHKRGHEQEGKEKESESYKNKVGKENVQKWLKILLENAREDSSSPLSPTRRNYDELNNACTGIMQKEINLSAINPSREEHCLVAETRSRGRNRSQNNSEINRMEITKACKSSSGSRHCSEIKERAERREGLPKFKSFPSSPSVVLGMRSVNCNTSEERMKK